MRLQAGVISAPTGRVRCRQRLSRRDAKAAFSSATSERQGEVINWLTIVAAVFLPLSFATGYFGMNLSVIMHLHGTLTFSLLAIILPLVLVVFTVLLLRVLVRPLGVRLIPSRAPRAVATYSRTESDVDGLRN
jgi:hypothetical protein